ncbi:protein mesh isoform X1 [Palaemon carinicauda]|uniref:protein mesh isoform X1 n=1 Tax=Palaemon carinicauda TaxID=392227 RepID=UPI0035B65C71
MRLGVSLALALLLVGAVAWADQEAGKPEEANRNLSQESNSSEEDVKDEGAQKPPTADGEPDQAQESKLRGKRQLNYNSGSSSNNQGSSSNSNSNSQTRYRSYSASNGPYTISKEELDRVRAELMYPYTDKDEHGGTGDLEKNINTQNTQVNKQLTFLLPFFGFGLNYTWVSLNGYLGFSDAPFNWQHYPLSFPVQEWPTRPDPSFIGPFYSKCNIGELKPGDLDTRRPGVYWRLERDLPSRQDQVGVTIRERLKWDIREGIVGAEIFTPKHAIIVTWKNVTFSGGSVNTQAKYVTNTFQLVVATDEIRTYCLFNYEYMAWTSHTEAGGSTDDGQGGVPAYVGFNAGNGTRSYEYTPYSQKLYIRDLSVAGNANGLPGRHIFRIDEKILAGCCRREEELREYPLTFAPEHGNMMGGTLVNVTGPCFKLSDSVRCQFDTTAVEGVVVSGNKAACIMPRLFVSGYVDFSISINGGPYYWKGKYFVETPLTAPEGVWFKDDSYQEHSPESLDIEWLAGNLTMNRDATVQISLWGYREISITPEIVYIDVLKDSPNIGFTTLVPQEYSNRDNRQNLDLEMGLIMINLTTPEPAYGVKESTIVWSRPIPLAWYFHYQWANLYGSNWQQAMCDRWIENDRNLRNFAYEVERCPCLLKQAVADKGRFLPDFSCDMDGNTECDYHFGAIHCVRTALPNKDGAGQQCCYDRDGYLMMTADKMWGGNPHRAHNLGKTPFDEANKVPSLSHWYHDVIPFYTCCKWQGEQAPGCVTFRFERRCSQNCVGYTPPSAATVFGDPHFYTFDDLTYTFNGKGEFVLVRVDSNRHVLDIQGRFEQIDKNYLGEIKGSMLTAIAARDNISSIVEVRRRPSDAIWRYHLDVIVDGERVYFDRYSQKIQQFRECVVYTPSNILNQSHVVVMFSSGAGIEVMENKGYLGGRIYLPLSFANITRGLFGNWTFDKTDDLVSPDGSYIEMPMEGTAENLYKWGLEWSLEDKAQPYKGKSLFRHENSRSSNYYYDKDFVPEYENMPILPENASKTDISEVNIVCGDSYQCYFDYVVTLKRDFADMTKYYQDQFVNIKSQGLIQVISCGALPTPPHGRKSTFNFLSGAEVKFDCDPGFVLLGEQRRWCYASGDWNWPENGEATCVTETEYMMMQQGITAGTVLAVLLPVLIAMLCFASYHRNKRKEYIESHQSAVRTAGKQRFSFVPSRSRTPSPKELSTATPSHKDSVETTQLAWEAPPPVPPRANELRLGHADSPSASDDGSLTSPSSDSERHSFQSGKKTRRPREDPLKSPQSFDGEYYTNEPVDDKPVVFQNVLWGIDEQTPVSKQSAV